MESKTYALLAGFQNFGGQVSSQIGIYATQASGISTTVSSQIGIYATQASGISTTVPCNFDNLSTLVVVSHCLLPLLAIPLTFVLIPDKLMTEKIINDDVHDEPTIFGSVMRGEKKGEKKPDAKAS
ncbi:hypothetical protein T484DRAFT_1774838 [Baffinella frigidus]|nr:hypothetical protein T484DRAFT_1774838 [Cryptophyta sp. CCMP2293]